MLIMQVHISGYDNIPDNTRNLHRNGDIITVGPYIEFRKNYCEEGKKYTLEDLYNTIDNTYWVVCFIPMFNTMTVTVSLVALLIIPLWNKIKRIRIV